MQILLPHFGLFIPQLSWAFSTKTNLRKNQCLKSPKEVIKAFKVIKFSMFIVAR